VSSSAPVDPGHNCQPFSTAADCRGLRRAHDL
jgi:hypothetical protein